MRREEKKTTINRFTENTCTKLKQTNKQKST